MSRQSKRACLIVCLIMALLAAATARAEDRLALVIGNAAYRNIPALGNPVNDARLMARTLRTAGFRVTLVTEADRATMTGAVERFGQEIRTAGQGALALFYFAGHGVRSDGFNYLLPVGADIRAEADIATESVAAEWVLERISAPGITNVMVLDACRNNPFDGRGPGKIPDLGDGLARMTARDGNLVAYATGPGDVALDGRGDNSPYTAALAAAIGTPGLDVEAVFAQVRNDVETATSGAQIPWESSSLGAAVYLQPNLPDAGLAAPGGDPAEGPLLNLAVTFRSALWSGGQHGGCNTRYSYDPVSLPSLSGPARRIRPVNGGHSVELELMASRGSEGVEISIVPVSTSTSGRQITALLAEITPGREHALYTHSRHPDLFACGMMTIHVSRDR